MGRVRCAASGTHAAGSRGGPGFMSARPRSVGVREAPQPVGMVHKLPGMVMRALPWPRPTWKPTSGSPAGALESARMQGWRTILWRPGAGVRPGAAADAGRTGRIGCKWSSQDGSPGAPEQWSRRNLRTVRTRPARAVPVPGRVLPGARSPGRAGRPRVPARRRCWLLRGRARRRPRPRRSQQRSRRSRGPARQRASAVRVKTCTGGCGRGRTAFMAVPGYITHACHNAETRPLIPLVICCHRPRHQLRWAPVLVGCAAVSLGPPVCLAPAVHAAISADCVAGAGSTPACPPFAYAWRGARVGMAATWGSWEH